MQKKAIITGIEGFIGRNLNNYLVGQGIEVFGIDRNTVSANNMYKIDLSNTDSKLSELFERIEPDYIFHASGVISSHNIQDYYHSNVIGTLNLFEALRKCTSCNPKIISIGSSAEYGIVSEDDLPITEDYIERPYNHYGISKLAQTKICLDYASKYNLNVIAVRLFNVLGRDVSNNLSVGTFINQAKNAKDGDYINVGNLKAKRDYIDVFDAVELIWRVANSDDRNIINICSGQATSMAEILDLIIKFSNKSLFIKEDPKRLKSNDIMLHFGSNAKLISLLGKYSFTNIQDTIKRVFETE